MKINKSIIFALTCLLSACASQPMQVADDDRSGSLFLRGSFTWWDAEEDYQIVRRKGQVYSVTVDLVADGQPYEFKFADETWSQGANCGYLDKASDELVTVGEKFQANCLAKYEPFRFTPTHSGQYDFIIDFSESAVEPMIWIEAHHTDIVE